MISVITNSLHIPRKGIILWLARLTQNTQYEFRHKWQTCNKRDALQRRGFRRI
jgi:hypothetical protein